MRRKGVAALLRMIDSLGSLLQCEEHGFPCDHQMAMDAGLWDGAMQRGVRCSARINGCGAWRENSSSFAAGRLPGFSV
jgi:hypothetical protein